MVTIFQKTKTMNPANTYHKADNKEYIPQNIISHGTMALYACKSFILKAYNPESTQVMLTLIA